MTLKTLQVILSTGFLTLFLSCKGQTGIAEKEQQDHSASIGEVVSELDDKTWSIYQDQKGNYWFGSDGNGVFHFDGKTLTQFTSKDGLVSNSIRGIQGDHLGNVFIQTPAGISKYDGKTFTILTPITSLSNEWKLEPNDLWFNCNGMPNDVYRYDGNSLFELRLPRQNLEKAFEGEVKGLGFKDMNSSPYSVFGINKDKKGNLWIGTIVAGAFRYDGKSFLWFPEKELTTLDDGRVPGVRSMIEDKDGNFWLSNVISKYKIIETGSKVRYEKLTGIDLSIEDFKDRLLYFNSGLSQNGALWMTTYTAGVWRYDGDNLTNLPVKDGEIEALLVSIYEDNSGTLWLGTNNLGVFRFNGETFEKFEPLKK